jgi:hypothetical protein
VISAHVIERFDARNTSTAASRNVIDLSLICRRHGLLAEPRVMV